MLAVESFILVIPGKWTVLGRRGISYSTVKEGNSYDKEAQAESTPLFLLTGN